MRMLVLWPFSLQHVLVAASAASKHSSHSEDYSQLQLLQAGASRERLSSVHESEEHRPETIAIAKAAKRVSPQKTKELSAKKSHAACTDLVNHGTHFTVEIEVGTPGQKFDVVADTGSDAIIVPSCVCVKAGYCNAKSRCFQGTNRSSTFAIKDGPQGPPTVRMMFGSGPVQAVVASDTVRVGKLKTKMEDGILLMTDQLLNIKGPFEGILGLGLPSADAKKGLIKKENDSATAAPPPAATMPKESAIGSNVVAEYETSIDSNIFPWPGGTTGSQGADDEDHENGFNAVITSPSQSLPTMNLAPGSLFGVSQRGPPHAPSRKTESHEPTKKHKTESHAAKVSNDTGIVVKGFMEEAGIDSFSMCFNDGSNGVLRLGIPKAKNAHGSVGQVHWGLDFRGISVGSVTAEVKFCSPENVTKGQKTPCGAIPDSGTTAFMAPKEHLISLYESICDEWDRCHKNYTAMVKAAKDARAAAIKAFNSDPFHIRPVSKAVIFQQMVLDCEHWLSKDKGLEELPPIHFHIAGANGTKQSLDLSGWSYVIETQEKEYKYIYKTVPGLGKLPVGRNFTGVTKKVCSPAFSPMEYSTEQNGPVWILGTPVFYEYQVGYDLKAKPPSISFTDAPCGTCGEPKASLMSQDATTHSDRSRVARSPRRVHGPLRVPNIDVGKPL